VTGQGSLTAHVHALKTPLVVIVGYAELLAGGGDEEFRGAAAREILTAARQLDRALDSLLGVEAAEPAAANGSYAKEGASRILLVDDDAFVRRLLRLTLSAHDFEIAEASDGDLALDLIDAQHPELVLLDWQMPFTPGSTVLNRLQERHPDLPVVVLTTDPGERAEAMRLGATAFLTKPFSPLGLLETIESLLGLRDAARYGQCERGRATSASSRPRTSGLLGSEK
jgi:CheY-like chemotaxis protein